MKKIILIFGYLRRYTRMGLFQQNVTRVVVSSNQEVPLLATDQTLTNHNKKGFLSQKCNCIERFSTQWVTSQAILAHHGGSV
jgi:hypothetical protein